MSSSGREGCNLDYPEALAGDYSPRRYHAPRTAVKIGTPEAVATPPCNTGVACTVEPEARIEALHDWWRFVVPLSTAPEVVLERFAPEGSERGGLFGYQEARQQGHVSVHFRPRDPNMGTMIDITGQGCRELEAVHGGSVWRDHAEWIGDRGGWCTRLDFSFDDVRWGLLDKAKIDEKMAADAFTSRMRKWKPEHEYETGRQTSWGYRLGTRSSEFHVAFYDKALERGVDHHWVRCEARFLGDKAKAVHGMYRASSDAPKLFAGLIREHLQFREVDGRDSNKSRWQVSPWWSEFLANAERVGLVIGRPGETMEKKERWIEKAVTRSLAMVMEARGGDLDYLTGLLHMGAMKMSKRDIAMVAAALEAGSASSAAECALEGADLLEKIEEIFSKGVAFA